MHAGGFTFQPGELAKIFLIVFLASYLRAKREVLAQGRLKDMGPLLVIWVGTMLVLAATNDIGSGFLYFGIFIAMLYIATGRALFVAAGLALFAAGGYLAQREIPHIAERVTIWLHPWTTTKVFCPLSGTMTLRQQCQSYQLVNSLYSIANGGFGGTGRGKGTSTTPGGTPLIPELKTDFIYSALAQELGLVGVSALILVFMVFVSRGMKIALQVDDGFSKLLAAGLTFAFQLQTFVIVGGILRICSAHGHHLPLHLLRRLFDRGELPVARRTAPRLPPRQLDVVNRQISRVAIVSLGLLAALIVATTYWQTWAAAGLSARQDNEIERVAQIEIRRGLIYGADGRTLLAANVGTKSSGGQTIYTRTYPNRGLAAQTVGYSTPSRSRAGLEASENSYLTASNADLGTIFSTLGAHLNGTTVSGNNLVLTIRTGAQRIADRLLAGSCGAAVALDPTTGAVDVMASSPGFNPNLLETADGYTKITETPSPCAPEAASPLFNRATEGLFPPGSTFKTITAAAALDANIYNPASTFFDPGYCTEYGKQITNALDQTRPEAYGLVNLVEAYQYSINAVFCNIGQKIGAKTILEEARRFGFYSVPPLETPAGERAASGLYHHGRLFDPTTTSGYEQVDPGRLAFGQETMLVTPLQMALVAAAVANGGVEMTPTLIKKVVSPQGSVIASLQPHVLRQATSPRTAAELRNMMVSVVQAGTGVEACISAWSWPARPARRDDHRQQHLRRLASSSRLRRAPRRRRGGRGRTPAERDRRADREADHGGDPCHAVEHHFAEQWPLTPTTR